MTQETRPRALANMRAPDSCSCGSTAIMTVVTRFAPSPTGLLHVGGVRTALVQLAVCAPHGRQVHPARRGHRSRALHGRGRARDSRWDGMARARAPTRDRTTRRSASSVIGKSSQQHAGRRYGLSLLLHQAGTRGDARGADRAQGEAALHGVCRDAHRAPARDSRRWCASRIRSTGEVVVDDLVHGPVTFQNSELDDLIIARSDGTPTYNFCVVVDDMDMGITHVIRGDDHLNNTPRQMNMLRRSARRRRCMRTCR